MSDIEVPQSNTTATPVAVTKQLQATTTTNGVHTPESTPGADTQRNKADVQQTKDPPALTGLQTPRATPGADQERNEADAHRNAQDLFLPATDDAATLHKSQQQTRQDNPIGSTEETAGQEDAGRSRKRKREDARNRQVGPSDTADTPIASIESTTEESRPATEITGLTVKDLYNEATKFVLALQEDPKSSSAFDSIIKINSQIENLDENDDSEIDAVKLRSIYRKAAPLKKLLEEDPGNVNGKKKLADLNARLALNKNILPEWRIPVVADLDTEMEINSLSKVTISEDIPPAVRKVQKETLEIWNSKGWAIYQNPEKEVILSYQEFGNGKSNCHRFCIMKPQAPYFTLVPKRDLNGAEEYLELRNKLRMETGAPGPFKPVGGAKFKSLLWIAPMPTANRIFIRCCCVFEDDSIEIITRTQFLTFEKDKTIIERCEEADLPKPSNVGKRYSKASSKTDSEETKRQAEKIKLQEEKIKLQDDKIKLQDDKIKNLERVVFEMAGQASSSSSKT